MGKNAQRRRNQMGSNGKSAEEIAAEALAQQPHSAVPNFPVIGLPMHYEFKQTDVQEGKKAVIMVITNSLGTFNFMMEAVGAEKFFEDGLAVARMSKSGLHIPGEG